mmetsp:Transcript_7030/g.14082  ORF Transcript_7030/g.14082 Transcript_7030/m.14082 type:complete len:325 (-) Transcript_7030:266-1240(-)
MQPVRHADFGRAAGGAGEQHSKPPCAHQGPLDSSMGSSFFSASGLGCSVSIASAAGVAACSARRKGSTPRPVGLRPISAMTPPALPLLSASVKEFAACCTCGVTSEPAALSPAPAGKCSASRASIPASTTPCSAAAPSTSDRGTDCCCCCCCTAAKMLERFAAVKFAGAAGAGAVAPEGVGVSRLPRMLEIVSEENGVVATVLGAGAALGAAAAGAGSEEGAASAAAAGASAGSPALGAAAGAALDGAMPPESMAISSECVRPPKPVAAGAGSGVPLSARLAFSSSACSLLTSSGLEKSSPFLRRSWLQKNSLRLVCVNSSNIT